MIFFADLRTELEKNNLNLIMTSCHAGAGDTWLGQYWGMDIFEFSKANNLVFYEAYIQTGMPYYSWRRCLAELKIYSAAAKKNRECSTHTFLSNHSR